MSQTNETVILQFDVLRRLRNRLKIVAAEHDLKMGELGPLMLDYLLTLMADEKTPPAFQQVIDRFKRAKAAKKADA